MKFVKHLLFTLRGKTYKVLSNHVADHRLPPSPDKNDWGNAVEFIEVFKEKDLGETSWVEIKPLTIASQVKRELTEVEKIHDQYVEFGSKVYPKSMMYDLLESGEIVEVDENG